MICTRLPNQSLKPVSVQEWAGSSHADMPDIPSLDIDAAHYRYVPQGSGHEMHTDGTIQSPGSTGFSLCSGLLLTDPETRTTTMAHLEPHSEAILRYLDQKPKDTMKRIALFYDSLSVRQTELEHLISSGYFGPVQQATAHFESGDTHWGMAFNCANSQVKILTQKPSQVITTFEV